MRPPSFTPWLLVATLTAAGAAAAAGYGLTAPKRYRADAKLLVTPVSAGDSTFAGLDLVREAAGRHTAAASVAVLVRSPQVADAVRVQLGLDRSREALLDDVDAHVVGASDVVEVDAEDTSAASAAQLANSFVDALLAQRTTAFQSRLASAIRRDDELLASSPTGPQAAELARRLAVLRSFQGQADPTIRRASTAIPPASESWPVLWLLVLAGAGLGLVLGAVAYLVRTLLGRRNRAAVPEYSRGMSEDAVNALAERLEQRIAARESALAARERDLQAKIDELRALEQQPLPAEPAVDDGREQALRAREAELAERERALQERISAVTQRELAVARAAARAAAEAAAAPPPEPPPAAAPEPPPAAAAPRGAYNLAVLEALVQERGAAFPERVDEWESTLFFLRDYAEADGSLAGSFDFLVRDTFEPLLD